tara:strand:+ start:1152 stop:1769 length:618 start_codon:yes stop_codon:yes gene_type:complete
MKLLKIKKAAMFGLDARIALAIFGALSVISGAALYSAIQQSKTTALLTEMSELGKAVEGYMLDTGQNLPLWTGAVTTVTAEYEDLLTSTASGWNGPYYSQPIEGANTYRYKHADYEYGHVYYLQESTAWGDGTHWAAYGCGNASFTGYCPIWIFISKVDKSIVQALDQQVDGGDGGTTGRLKYTYPTGVATDATWHVFYKVAQKM